MSQVLNIHSLIHVSDDVKKFGCTLSDFTAFPFENELGFIRLFMRSGNKPLAQLCERMAERDLIKEKVVYPKDIHILRSIKKKSEQIIKKIKYKNYILSIQKPNNIVLMKNKEFLQITKIFQNASKTFLLEGIPVNRIEKAFDYPLDTCEFDIFIAKVDQNVKKEIYYLNDVERKAMLLHIYECPYETPVTYVVPFLHM